MNWNDEVKAEPLHPNSRVPLLVRPAQASGPALLPLLQENLAQVRQALLHHGAVLFRGFSGTAEADFPAVVSSVGGQLLDYVYRSTPRTNVGAGVYTATEYPANATIPQHNENAYQRDWPMLLGFLCAQAARSGGQTPLSDSVRISERLGPEFLDRFAHRRIMYVRNYGPGLDLPWSTVFQTQERAEVEAFCRAQEIQWEWLPGDRLRTRQVCQAVATHPETGQRLWFNQAHLFHVSALDPETREAMLELYSEEELPRNAYLGDGSPLAPADLDALRHAIDQETLSFPWHTGDLLLVDNMQVAHGRKPFQGPRRVLVAMARPFSSCAT